MADNLVARLREAAEGFDEVEMYVSAQRNREAADRIEQLERAMSGGLTSEEIEFVQQHMPWFDFAPVFNAIMRRRATGLLLNNDKMILTLIGDIYGEFEKGSKS